MRPDVFGFWRFREESAKKVFFIFLQRFRISWAFASPSAWYSNLLGVCDDSVMAWWWQGVGRDWADTDKYEMIKTEQKFGFHSDMVPFGLKLYEALFQAIPSIPLFHAQNMVLVRSLDRRNWFSYFWLDFLRSWRQMDLKIGFGINFTGDKSWGLYS